MYFSMEGIRCGQKWLLVKTTARILRGQGGVLRTPPPPLPGQTIWFGLSHTNPHPPPTWHKFVLKKRHKRCDRISPPPPRFWPLFFIKLEGPWNVKTVQDIPDWAQNVSCSSSCPLQQFIMFLTVQYVPHSSSICPWRFNMSLAAVQHVPYNSWIMSLTVQRVPYSSSTRPRQFNMSLTSGQHVPDM